MPFWDLRCTACDATYGCMFRNTELRDAWLKDQHCTKTPKCPGVLEVVMPSPAFHLKGAGFYKNDYATEKRPADDKS